MDAALLGDEVGDTIFGPLERKAATTFPHASVEDLRPKVLLARFPGWAALIAAAAAQVTS
jgi:hypothetical protein